MTVTRQDILIDHLIERRIVAGELAELAAAARADGELWERVAGALSDEETIRLGIDHAERLASVVELPRDVAVTAADREPAAVSSRSSRSGIAWSGWAVAALLAIAFIVGQFAQPVPAPSTEIESVELPQPAPTLEEVLAQYVRQGIDAGQVLRELPHLTVAVEPDPEGVGMRVWYVRRLLESTTVEDFLTFGVDEHGRPVMLPAAAPPQASRHTL